MTNKKETAVFGGGCFWCTEAIFNKLRGVLQVTSGYAGGSAVNPGYTSVSRGETGHAEVVKIEFDPEVISFEQLLEVFFALHDPTTKNQQGADVGTQYRSIILYTSAGQKDQADKAVRKITGAATEVKSLENFYTAEEYHQKFYDKNPDYPYCRAVISPKLEKLEQKFKKLIL